MYSIFSYFKYILIQETHPKLHTGWFKKLNFPTDMQNVLSRTGCTNIFIKFYMTSNLWLRTTEILTEKAQSVATDLLYIYILDSTG